MKFHSLLFSIHQIIFLFEIACCMHRKVYITAGVSGLNCCGQLTSVACYAGQHSGFTNPCILCNLNYDMNYTFTFSVFSLKLTWWSLRVYLVLVPLIKTNFNLSASSCVISNFVAVKGTSVIVTSPPITLINYPNRVAGPMTQVTEDIAEAVEFVLRYDVESRNNLPGVYS